MRDSDTLRIGRAELEQRKAALRAHDRQFTRAVKDEDWDAVDDLHGESDQLYIDYARTVDELLRERP